MGREYFRIHSGIRVNDEAKEVLCVRTWTGQNLVPRPQIADT